MTQSRQLRRQRPPSLADVVRKEAASTDLGAKMGQLADKVVQTVTMDAVKPANA
jgi:hypothetical protein